VTLLERALADPERGLGGRLCAERAALARIAAASDGDARRALTLLEAAAGLAGGEPGAPAALVDELLVEALQKKTLRYDKSGEEHYNLVSALHKSVRNCDADASVYWITRMLAAGEDRDFLARRLVRMAIEDVGLADPAALGVTLDAADAWHRLGSPEGELALVMAAAHLARAPKSNAVDSAYRAALADVERTSQDPVPLHLCNAPTGLMKAHGYGEGYRYAHDDPAAVGQMPCLPPGLAGRRYLHARVIRPAIQPPGPDTPRAAGSIRPERPPHGSPGGPDRA
jgi:putative ATPase